MTAWQEVQLDWATKVEDGLMTGVLLWDLSAAFDTLDFEGLCQKLAVSRVQEAILVRIYIIYNIYMYKSSL